MELNWLIYILPALGWGIMPIIAKKIGGEPSQQLLGTTLTALVVTVLMSSFFAIEYTGKIFLVSLISGVFWTFGQLLQFEAIKRSSVSTVMPISNGAQLLFTSLFSGIFLGEWSDLEESIISLVMLIMMVIGIFIMTKSNITDRKKFVNLPVILLSSFFLMVYVTITHYFKISGIGIFMLQSIGMVLTAIAVNRTLKTQVSAEKIKMHFFTGAAWVIANISLFYTSVKIGVSLSFSISQICLLVSTLGGIFILKEKKNKEEWVNIVIGAILIGCSIIVLSRYK